MILEYQAMIIDSHPFQNFFPNPSVDPVRFFLPNVYKLNILSRKRIKTVGAEATFEDLQFIFYND